MMPIYQSAAAYRDLARTRMAVRQRMATGSTYPLGPVEDPLLHVAIHEAGHCVVARLEGSPINSVMINGSERGGGRMRLHNANDLTCTILLAGMAAERVVLGFAEKECARTDLYHARGLARRICSDVDAFLDRELDRTIGLLEIHRDALLALAAEIVGRRYLDGGEVNRVLNKALGSAH
jgi:hypothetical protein